MPRALAPTVVLMLLVLAGCSSPQYVTLQLDPAGAPLVDCAAHGDFKSFDVRRVAVTPFKADHKPDRRTWAAPDGKQFPVYEYPVQDTGPYVAERFERVLADATPLDVVDRSRVRDVMNEQSFQGTVFVDPETAAGIGKLAGADAILVGTVNKCRSELVSRTSGRSFLCTPIPHMAFKAKLIHVETGTVLYNCEVSGSSLNYLEESRAFRSDELIRTQFAPLNNALGGRPGKERMDYLAIRLVRAALAELPVNGK